MSTATAASLNCASTAERITLRPAGPADLPALLALNRRFYGDEHWVNAEFFGWRFGPTPAGDPISWLALDGDTLAGTYSVLPVPLRMHGRDVLGSVSFGLLMNPDYATVVLRRAGRLQTLFLALAERVHDECRQRGLLLSCVFPNARSLAGFVNHLGFKQVDDLRFRVRPLAFRRLVALKWPGARALSWLAGGLARAAFGVLYPAPRSARFVRVVSLAWNDARLDELWRSAADGWPIARVRDAAYYRWRFESNPFAMYHLLGALEGERLVGTLVYTLQAFHDRQRGLATEAGAIADWFVSNNEAGAQVLTDLLVEAAARLCSHECRRDACTTTPALILAADNRDALWRAAFRRAGFYTFPAEKAPRKFPFLVQVHEGESSPRAADAFESRNWFITLADNDVV
ncbi:MAG TPA: GNAT family N-acetyltransferase [Phycisphaerae bacterium]